MPNGGCSALGGWILGSGGWRGAELDARASAPTLEVKSTAYLQAWPQQELSRIRFPIEQRAATAYGFCLLEEQDPERVDPQDLTQGRFWVVPPCSLHPEHRSIGLRALVPPGACPGALPARPAVCLGGAPWANSGRPGRPQPRPKGTGESAPISLGGWTSLQGRHRLYLQQSFARHELRTPSLGADFTHLFSERTPHLGSARVRRTFDGRVFD